MTTPHHNGNYEDPVLQSQVRPRNAYYLAVNVLPDGSIPHVYHRSTLETILTTNPVSPITRTPFRRDNIRRLVPRAVTRSATRRAARNAARDAAAAAVAAAAVAAAAAARTAALSNALNSLRREARISRIPITRGGIDAASMAQKLEIPAWFGLGVLVRADRSYMWQVKYARSKKLGIFSRRHDGRQQLVICDFHEHQQPQFVAEVVVNNRDEFVSKFLHFINTKMAQDSMFTGARRYRRADVAPLR